MTILRTLLITILAVYSTSNSSLAQTSPGQDSDSPAAGTAPPDHDNPNNKQSSRGGANPITDPNEIPIRLSEIRSQCKRSGPYVIDCLAERLEALELDMADLGGHGMVRKVLRETASDLRSVVRQNTDPAKPRARMQNRDASFRSTRTLAAIAPQSRRASAAQAVAILNEAETTLLRSAENSNQRTVQYQQIAAALGSNKVLLRSA